MKRKRGRPRNKGIARHLKRPPNAFVIFSQEIRSLITKKHGKNTPKIIGRMWKALSAEKKKPYLQRAQHLDEVHRLLYPHFVSSNSFRQEYDTSYNLNSGETMTSSTQESEGEKSPEQNKLIKAAPWSSPPHSTSPISVKPSWNKRRKKSKKRFKIPENTTLQDQDGLPTHIPHPSKVRFRIVPAQQPHTYISRDKKNRQKQLEKMKDDEEGNREIIRIVTANDLPGSGHLSTPVLVKCKGYEPENTGDDYTTDEHIELLGPIPFTEDPDLKVTDFEESKIVRNVAKKKPTDPSIKKERSQDVKPMSNSSSSLKDSSISCDLSFLFAQNHVQKIHEKTGDYPDWWNEFEFLCSPMAKASISLASKATVLELSENPLQPAKVIKQPSMDSPELPRIGSSEQEYHGLDNSLGQEISLPLPELSEADLDFVQNWPIVDLHGVTNITDLLDISPVPLSNDNHAPEWPGKFTNSTSLPESNHALSPPGECLTHSVIDTSMRSTLNTSSSSSKGSFQNPYNVRNAYNTEDNHLTTASTPQASNVWQWKNEPPMTNHLDSNDSYSPDLSPFLSSLANMSSPLDNDPLDFLGGDILGNNMNIHETPGRNPTETPRTPIKTTQETLVSLRKHPISQLTSPKLPMLAVSEGLEAHHLVFPSPNTFQCHNMSRASPGKHTYSGNQCEIPAKRWCFPGKAKVHSMALEDAEWRSPVTHSLDTETQNAVEALLDVKF